MRISSRLLLLALPCTLFMIPALAWSHGGGLDSYGCHHDRKAGGYHCHQGPLAGQTFASQADMLEALRAQEEKKKELPKSETIVTTPATPAPHDEPKGAFVKGSPGK